MRHSNPEIQKYIRLEFSTHRLILMPIIILAILFLAFTMNDSPHILESVQAWSYAILVVLLYIWGGKLSSDSVIGEVAAGTWVSAKISPVSALQMLLGKLWGSTIYVWYGAAFVTLANLVIAFMMPKPATELLFLFSVLIGAVFVHAMSIILTLGAITKNELRTAPSSTGYFIITLIAGGYLFALAVALRTNYKAASWFGIDTSLQWLSFAAIVFYTTWAVIGAYRSLASELMYPKKSIWLLMFLTTGMLFSAGFAASIIGEKLETLVAAGLFLASILPGILAYFTLLTQTKTPLSIKHYLHNVVYKGFWQALAPTWLISFLVFAASLIVLSIYMVLVAPKTGNTNFSETNAWILPASILFFAIRDFSIFIYNNLSEKLKRPDAASVIYLAILYILVPAILGAIDFNEAISAFVPYIDQLSVGAFLFVVAQATVMAALAYVRIKKMLV